MSKKARSKPSRVPQLLVASGVILAALLILAIKKEPEALPVSNDPPVIQLESALTEGKPVLAFYHSNNCDSCLQMIDTVNQVYPEFAEAVVLVDVNVYDQQNESLLRKAGVQYIPTLMFHHPSGRVERFVGVMEKDQLRQALSDLAGGG